MIINYKDIHKIELSFYKPLKYSNDYSFIPIRIKNKYVFQTPYMFIPYGIVNTYNNKIIDLSFYNKENDKSVEDFHNSLVNIYLTIQKKYKSYKVNSFFKKTQYEDLIRLKIKNNVLYFNSAKQQIDTIQANSYGRFLIHLYGLWISKNEIWIQWHLIQAQMIEPIQFNHFYIDQSTNEKTNIKKSPPPPPPLPKFKKTTSTFNIRKSKKKKKINPHLNPQVWKNYKLYYPN